MKNYLFLPNYKISGNYSFLDLVNIAKKYKLYLKGYSGNNLDKVKTPCIALIKGVINNHYVLITKISKRNVCYNDPATGKRIVLKKTFLAIFKGKYLIVDQFIPNILNKPQVFYFPFIPFITLFICGHIFIVSNLFFNQNLNVNILILILIFLINLIVNNMLKNRALKRIKKYCDISNIRHEEFIELSQNYVTYYSLPIKFLEKIIVFLFIITSYIPYFNLFKIFLIVFICIIHSFVANNLVRTKYKISLLERLIFIDKTKKESYFTSLKKHMFLSNLSQSILIIVLGVILLIYYFITYSFDYLHI